MEKCKYCDRTFNTKNALNAHLGWSHKDELSKLNVVIGNDTLDITNGELKELRSQHSGKCDICGKYETANTQPHTKDYPNQLCVDHDHNTKMFRGFICVQCNRNMGWLDKYMDSINEYNKPYKLKK